MLGSRFADILRQHGTLRLLLPALVARIPDSIAATGIVVLVRSAIGSYSVAGLTAGAFGIRTAVSAPLAGRALDRLGQRRVLVPLAAAFAAALTGLVVAVRHTGPVGLALLAAAAGLTRPPIEAALRALWPRLVQASRLDAVCSGRIAHAARACCCFSSAVQLRGADGRPGHPPQPCSARLAARASGLAAGPEIGKPWSR